MDFTISLILYLTLYINLGPGAQCDVLYGLYEWELVLQKKFHPKVRNHGEGPY